MPTARNFRVEAGAGGHVVTGAVECPTGGWSVLLVPDPAASSPDRTVLTVRATQPAGIVAQVITPYDVARPVSGVGEVVVNLADGVTTADGGTTIVLPIP